MNYNVDKSTLKSCGFFALLVFLCNIMISCHAQKKAEDEAAKKAIQSQINMENFKKCAERGERNCDRFLTGRDSQQGLEFNSR